MTTSLGMPSAPPRTAAPAWRTAWDTALYGADGFFRRESPAAHFQTSVHGSELLAAAVVELARRTGLTHVTDIGAGGGELVAALHRLAPDLRLSAVEVAPRPAGLPDAVTWRATLPRRLQGLVVANEWLDNVPCHVVEVDPEGQVRVVHVDPDTGQETFGLALTAAGVPSSLGAWLDRWWPLSAQEPGTRAEVGSSRDRAWGDVVGRLEHGLAVAMDYGHTRAARPAYGSLRSYRSGRPVELRPDGSRDVTAHVAVDALAGAVPHVSTAVRRQSEVLALLGVGADRPPLSSARREPQAYVAELAESTRAAALRAPGGFGDFYWVISAAGGLSADLL